MKKLFYAFLILGLTLNSLIAMSQDITLSVNLTNLNCYQSQDGAIDLSITGGIGSYTILWSGPNGFMSTQEDLSALESGTYAVVVTDQTGATAQNFWSVIEPGPIVITGQASPVSCNGMANGGITLTTITGGTLPYEFHWSDGNSTQNLTNFPAGTYTITVSDINACAGTATFDITEPGELMANGTTNDVSCNGGTNGEISFLAKEGTPPYTYLWNNGATTADLTGVAAGDYSVTVTDAANCWISQQFTINQPPALSLNETQDNVLCYGTNGGSINITVAGGTLPYAFLWSDLSALEDLNNLYSGNYGVTVTDGLGCTITGDYTLTQTDSLQIIAAITSLNCFGESNGSIDISVSGGSAPYQYAWTGGLTDEDLSGKPAGTYTLTLTDDNNCLLIRSFHILQPQFISILAVSDSVDCLGESNGGINLTIGGGTPGYTFLWSNGLITEDISGLSAGLFSVTVTDANSCVGQGNYTVSEPATLSITGITTNVSCQGGANGSIDISVQGGNSSFSYLWSNGATTQDVDGLIPGAYAVTVTDFHNCTAIALYNITEPDLLVITGTITNNTCFAAHNGSISTAVTGGTGPFTYLWSNAAATADISDLSSGIYNVTVTDDKACAATNGFTITEPAVVIAISGTTTPVSCPSGNNGQIALSLTGGNAPYTYLWSNSGSTDPLTALVAGDYQVTVTDADNACSVMSFTISQPQPFSLSAVIGDVDCNGNANGTINPNVSGASGPYDYSWTGPNGFSSTLDNLSGLVAGDYDLTITDNNACAISELYTVNQPSVLSLVGSPSPALCFGGSTGSIDLTVSGGTAPYEYLWSNADVNEDLSGIPANTYFLTVTDNHGCVATGNWTVTEPTDLTITLDLQNNVVCPGGANGEVQLTAGGGLAPFTYLWEDGSVSEDRNDLNAGIHSLTVTDLNQCTITTDFTLTDPDDFNLSPVVTAPLCHGFSDGDIALTVSGGTPSYTFLWSNGATTEDVSGLAADTFQVVVTDALSCIFNQEIIVTEPGVLIVVGVPTDPTCYQFSDGEITTSTFAGTPSYDYLWNDGATSADRAGLVAGIYSVTVTDSHGCTDDEPFTLSDPAQVTGVLTIASQSLTCSGTDISTIDFTADYYTPGQTSMSWTRDHPEVGGNIPMLGNGPISGTLVNNADADITVTFTITGSAVGCNGPNLTSSVTVPPSMQDSVHLILPIMCAGDSALYQFFAYRGTPPYVGDGIRVLYAGENIITITDAAGCVFTDTIILEEPTPLEVTYIAHNPTCVFGSEGSIEVTTAGGTPPYTWYWSDGYADEDRYGLQIGTYYLTVTDNHLCSVVQEVVIGYDYTSPTAYITAPEVVCSGYTHPITVHFTGTPPFNFTYTDGYQFFTFTDIPSFTYTFNVNPLANTMYSLLAIQDANCPNGLVTGIPAIVLVTPLPGATMQQPAAICFGDTATITVDLIGTPPWSIAWNDGTEHIVTNILSSPYEIKVSPDFNHNYYLSFVGDANCFNTNLGLPVTVVVRTRPSATLSGGGYTRCYGVEASLPVFLTGVAPWTISYTDGTSTTTVTGITNQHYNIIANPGQSMTFSLLSVQDAYCSGSVAGEVLVTIYPRPLADWTGSLDTICEGSSGTFSINLSGTPPWSVSWFDNAPHTATNILTTPFTFSASPAFSTTFIVTSLSDAHCQATLVGQTLSVFVDKTPTASFVSHTPMCSNTGGDLIVNLTGIAPWRLSWMEDSITYIDSNIMVTPHVIHVTPSVSKHYSLVAVEDAYCTGTVDSAFFLVDVFPSPTATISGLSANMSVCLGSEITVTPDFQGEAPYYNLLFLDPEMNFLNFNNMHQGDVASITPPLVPGTYSYQLISLTDSNGCFIMYNTDFSITVLSKPVVNAGPDSSFYLGDSLTMQGSFSDGTAPFSINWIPAAHLSQSDILDPVAKPISTTTYTLQVSDDNGCVGTDDVLLTVIVEQAVFGYITYNNNVSTPLNSVKVVLLNHLGVRLDSTSSNASGYYELSGIPDGNYSLQLSSAKPWLLQNSVDALLIMKNFVNMSPLYGLRLKAVNVDDQGVANAVDALLVAKRFTGQVTSFNLGDWVFEDVNFTIPAVNYQHDIKGLCTGDANGSSTPTGKFGSQLELLTMGELAVESGSSFEIPVRFSQACSVGAMSLVFNYPSQKLQIESISMPGVHEAPIYHIANDEIRIAWYNLSPFVITEESPVLLIKASLRSSFGATDVDFTLSAESQVVNEETQEPENLNLIMPKLIAATPAFTIETRPNPAINTTHCVYSLGLDAYVNLTLSDLSGKEIRILQQGNKAAGNHELDIDVNAVAPGLYFLKLEAQDVTGSALTKVIKLNIVK